MLLKIIGIFSIPIMLLNFSSGIIGGIWLAFLGEWQLIGIGFALLFTASFSLSILMLPSIPIAGIATYFLNKRNPLGHIFGYLSQAYTNLLIIGTCALAIAITAYYYGEEAGFRALPYLLWSWGMALGPWQFFASKEPDNEFTAITIFSASAFYLLFLISIFISFIFTVIVVLTFVVVQLIVLPIYNLYTLKKMDDIMRVRDN